MLDIYRDLQELRQNWCKVSTRYVKAALLTKFCQVHYSHARVCNLKMYLQTDIEGFLKWEKEPKTATQFNTDSLQAQFKSLFQSKVMNPKSFWSQGYNA